MHSLRSALTRTFLQAVLVVPEEEKKLPGRKRGDENGQEGVYSYCRSPTEK